MASLNQEKDTMRNSKFERAARARRSVAIFLALLFHLGLLGYVIFNQQANHYIEQMFASETKVEIPHERP